MLLYIHMDTSFNSSAFEKRIYKLWKEHDCFAPAGNSEPFVIVIPPPNVTGVLHMGHGLNKSLQDILIRYHRMLGRKTLWIPGTDHAGIATQSIVEQQLSKEGKTRYDLGREEFTRRTWELCNKHKEIITKQLEAIGSSCDWSRYRFTLDADLSAAVSEVFIRLYEKGLIYRGRYMVNWSVQSRTALSNEEVEFKEIHGTLYYVRYPFADGDGEVTIATTRPETMFGDTAVAVHPEDKRYIPHIGRKLILPLSGRTIPLIADNYVDPSFGSGALKITPAHDQNDYDIGLRHGLEIRMTMTLDGKLNENVPEAYQGLDMKTAQKKIAADLEKSDYLVSKKQHIHQVGHCYRTGDIIEPYLSMQWFVQMKPLAEQALASWEKGEVRFFPEKWANTYLHWLRTIRDWCISRQLWWGHRIPAWYDNETEELIVSHEDPSTLPQYAGRSFTQDESVLDTWFSSWLWPFTTLGWPKESKDMQHFYPTSTLVTGYDIIFFWVARMIMAGLEFTQQVPFRDIYITNLVRDKKGRKMSKSLGNGIDPLAIVEDVGADAMRFTLAFNAAQGTDILMDAKDFQFGSRFTNKLWNASRYILMQLDKKTILPFTDITLDTTDKWIYHQFNACRVAVGNAMEQYRFNDAAHAVYEYFWNDFCDWYLEASKLYLYGDSPEQQNRAISILLYLLEETLRLIHPFLPFISEEIYQKIPPLPKKGDGLPCPFPFLIQAAYPSISDQRECPEIAALFPELQEIVRLVRTARSEFTIAFSRPISFSLRHIDGWKALDYIEASMPLIALLTNGRNISLSPDIQKHEHAIVSVSANAHFEVHMLIKDVINIESERERLRRAIEKSTRLLIQTEKKLINDAFLAHAKEEVIAREQAKKQSLSEQLDRTRTLLGELE